MTDASHASIAAVRGATAVPGNTPAEILEHTTALLTALMTRNGLAHAQVVSALFTATADLDADFPAHAARRMGWDDVPMLCAREIPVPGSLPRIVRVMLTVRVHDPRARLVPVYLGEAAGLRPDLAPQPGSGATRRIAIVGLGQIGGSIGLALAGRGWRRVGFDRDAATLDAAEAAAAIDERAAGIAGACAGADLALIAVPVDALPRAIADAAASLPPGAALLDTGSARGPLTPALAAAAELGIAAVGGHPLAGSEGRGLAAARADLFRGAGFALMPAAVRVPEIIEALVHDIGARPGITDPLAHDRALARTSHLPYLLSCALLDEGAAAAASGLSGPGFRDMTRLAGSDPQMAGAYCRANASEIRAAWNALRERIEVRVAELPGAGGGPHG
jgi:prephenate dehydrogenase